LNGVPDAEANRDTGKRDDSRKERSKMGGRVIAVTSAGIIVWLFTLLFGLGTGLSAQPAMQLGWGDQSRAQRSE
jgi:hypothetical protein